MTPDAIESSAAEIRKRLVGERSSATLLFDRKTMSRLKLAHSAAINAAQLWRGCIPLEGYSVTGTVEQRATGRTLCVTG
jgi:hypothetical protein